MKKLYILLILITIIFGISLTGCKENKEEKKDEVEKPPSSLVELQKLTDEVIESTMKKDWSGSLTKTKEVQSSWTELYPELQKKGVSKDDVDNFVKDLNTLSDALIAKTLTLPKEKKVETKSKSEDSESGTGEKEESEPQDTSGGEATDVKNKDPEKALEEVDPMMEVNTEEIIIVGDSVELLKHMPKFTGLFAGKVPADVFQLKYLIYHINVTSKEGNLEDTNKVMSDILEVWKSVEPKALEVDENLKLQVSQSIKEIEDVVGERKDNLIGMKSNSSLEMVEELIKGFEDKEK